MAKQLGLHQIRGKVGGYSYYKQSGVSAGLIRSINEGMSARVKTGEEYANTRLNNVEFGGACKVAGLLGKLVSPKFRPMILPFSQSQMAKQVLELARTSSDPWGTRVVPSGSSDELAAILAARSKRDPFEFINSFTLSINDPGDYNVNAGYTAEQATLMASLGITHLTVTAKLYKVGTGKYSVSSDAVIVPAIGDKGADDLIAEHAVTAGTEYRGGNDIPLDITPMPSTLWNTQYIAVFVVLPIREVGGVKHILQEYCSFYAAEIPTE